MVHIELSSETARVDVIGNGSGLGLRFSFLGPTPEVAFLQELIEEQFTTGVIPARELFAFLEVDPWVQSVFGKPTLASGSLDPADPLGASDDFGRLALGRKLVVAGLINETELNHLLDEYAPYSESQRFGEFLKLRMHIPHQVIDFMLGLSSDELAQFNGKRLGERLIAMGLINPQSLEEALHLQAEQPDRRRLGDILVELGAITPELAEFFSRVSIHSDGSSLSYPAESQTATAQSNL